MTMKLDQGQRNWHENVKLNGGNHYVILNELSKVVPDEETM